MNAALLKVIEFHPIDVALLPEYLGCTEAEVVTLVVEMIVKGEVVLTRFGNTGFVGITS